jgi:hypothetical protein
VVSLALIALMVFITLVGCGREPLSSRGSMKQSLAGMPLLDLAGQPVEPFQMAQAKAVVFIFVSPECPISNRYAPEMKRLHEEYSSKGIAFWLVYCDPDESVETIRKHLREYQLSLPALRDPRHALVRKAQVRVTPEAAVFTSEEHLVYHGRIDDRTVDFGKDRPAPTHRDLHDVLEAILAGQPPAQSYAPAVGCYIADLP